MICSLAQAEQSLLSKKMAGPYNKGTGKAPWQEPSGSITPTGGGKGHGGASAHWRANMRSLCEFYYPELPMGVFLTNLVAYAKSQWNLRKEDWDTARSYLMRVHQECAAGLGWRAGQGLALQVNGLCFDWRARQE